MGALLDELRQALRRLRRHWGFSLTFIVTLGLAVGANGGVFTAIYAYLFQPLPWPDADHLVVVQNHQLKTGWIVNAPYFDMSKVQGVESGGRATEATVTAVIDGTARSLWAAEATPSLFRTLKVRPFLGTWLDAMAGKPGAPKEVVLSYRFWQSAFHADQNVLGLPLKVDGKTYRIVGVMPRGFFFPHPRVEFWTAIPTAELTGQFAASAPGRAVARIAPHVSLNQGSMALETRGQEILEKAKNWKWFKQVGSRIKVTPLREWLGHEKSRQLLLMQAGALALLLLAIANLANLALVHALRRRHEFAMRAALGARRGTLLRVAVAEALPLGLAAGGFGLLLSNYAAATLANFGFAGNDAAFQFAITAPVAVVIVVAAIIVALFAMAAPLLMVRSDRLEILLKQADEHSGGSRNTLRVRRSLSTLQIALAVLLLSGAALIGLSLRMMVAHDPGFNANNLMVAHLPLRGPKYEPGTSATANGSDDTKIKNQRYQAYRHVQQATAALPGIEAAGMGSGLPFTGWGMVMTVPPPTAPDSAQRVTADGMFANASLLHTLDVRLLKGRLLTQPDVKNDAKAVVVDAALARALFGTIDVVGREIGDKKYRKHIVGVIATINDKFSDMGRMGHGKIIFPAGKSFMGGMMPDFDLVVRSELPPQTVAKELRTMLHKTLPDQSFSKIATMQSFIQKTAQGTSALAALLIACGIVALALASIGTYGVIAQLGRARRREFAVRIALGARPLQIERLVLRSGVVLWAFGSAAGISVAVWMGILFSDRLYKVSVFDPAPYAVATVSIGMIVLLASWLPARAVRRLDLSDALHEE